MAGNVGGGAADKHSRRAGARRGRQRWRGGRGRDTARRAAGCWAGGGPWPRSSLDPPAGCVPVRAVGARGPVPTGGQRTRAWFASAAPGASPSLLSASPTEQLEAPQLRTRRPHTRRHRFAALTPIHDATDTEHRALLRFSCPSGTPPWRGLCCVGRSVLAGPLRAVAARRRAPRCRPRPRSQRARGGPRWGSSRLCTP